MNPIIICNIAVLVGFVILFLCIAIPVCLMEYYAYKHRNNPKESERIYEIINEYHSTR